MGNRTSGAAPSGDSVSQTWLVIDDGESESIRFDPKQSQALCIGVGKQTKLDYGDLGPAADNDAIALADVLVKTFSFPESQVQLYHSIYRHATKRRILESLRRAARATKPRGLLLVQFACHVVKLNRRNHGDEAYLVPSDYSKKSNWRTAISASEIAEAVRGSSASYLVIVMDCCHAGHIATDLVIKTDIKTYVMASCTSTQRSLSFKELGHGFFTYFLLRHLATVHGSSGPLPLGTVTKERALDDVDNGPDTRDMMMRRPQPTNVNSSPLSRDRITGVAGLLAVDGCTSWPVTSAVEYCKPLCQAIVDLVSPTFGGNLRMDPLVIRNTWTEHSDYDVTDFLPKKLDYLEKYMRLYQHTKVAPVWNHTVLWLGTVANVAVSVLCKAGYLADDKDVALYATAMAFSTQSCLHLMHDYCKRKAMVDELYKPLCFLEMYETIIMQAYSQPELMVKPGLTHLVYSLQHYIVMLRDLEQVTYGHDSLVDLLHLLTGLLTECGTLSDKDVTDSGGNQSIIDEVINMLQQISPSHQWLPPPDLDSPDTADSPNGSPESSDDNLHSDNHLSPREVEPIAQHSQAFLDEHLNDEQVLIDEMSDNLRLS